MPELDFMVKKLPSAFPGTGDSKPACFNRSYKFPIPPTAEDGVLEIDNLRVIGMRFRMIDLLCIADKYVDDNEENNGVRPVTDKCRT
jgi:hypothetical protein